MPTVRGGRVFGAFKPIAGSGGLPVDLVGHQVERSDESVANGLVPWEKHWSRSSSVPTRCVDDEEEEAQVQRRSGWRGPLALAMPGWIARGWRGRALRVGRRRGPQACVPARVPGGPTPQAHICIYASDCVFRALIWLRYSSRPFG